jgi:phage N-6-adenine-methyltransferase
MNGKDTALFSRASDEWETPQWLFDLMDQEFHFQVDAAASPDNNKTPISIGYDSLTINWVEWFGSVEFWLNPPYSKIAAFMKKAYDESQKGATVVCLIPARTDTRYWHDYVMKAHEIRFVKRRVSFYGKIKVPGQPKDTPKDQIKYMMGWAPAPFPSVIVIFDQSRAHGVDITFQHGSFESEIHNHPKIGETIEQPKKKAAVDGGIEG